MAEHPAAPAAAPETGAAFAAAARPPAPHGPVGQIAGAPRPRSFRPLPSQFHVRPPTNWINDPNGPMYDPASKTYHLFTQYNPFGSSWGHMSWSHSASLDLVRWWHLPVALWPNQTYDQDGVFSGSVSIVDGAPLLSYTCVGPKGQLQCQARPVDASDPDLVEWAKDEANPVIGTPPPGVPADSFRDPTTAWTDGGLSRIAVGAAVNGVGHVSQYSTTDFESWKFEGFMYADASGTHAMFECPDFYPVGPDSPSQTYVMKISDSGDWYALGAYDSATQSFQPRQSLRRYMAGTFYASKRFYDPVQQRQVLFGWVQESSPTTAQRGWQGSMTLPMEVTYDAATDSLRAFPIAEVASLRNQSLFSASNITVKAGSDTALPGATGLMLQVTATFALPSAERSAWRRCVEARWSPSTSDSQRLDSCRAALAGRTGAGPTSSQSYGVGVRANLAAGIETRLGFQHVSASGPLNNTDMPGGDYRDFALPASAPAEQNIQNCSQTCLAEPQCVAWTYVRDGGPAATAFPVPRCSLKSSAPPADTNKWCVSGTVPSLVQVNDQSRAGGDGAHSVVAESLPIAKGASVSELSVWVDHSVIESFANRGLGRIVTRSYPDATANGVTLFADGAGVQLMSIDVASVESIWVQGRPRL